MDLEGIVLSEMSEKDKYCMISLICGNLKTHETSKYNNNKKRSRLTDVEDKLVVTSEERPG